MYDVNMMAEEISKDISQDLMNESFGVTAEELKVEKKALVTCKHCGAKVEESQKTDYCPRCAAKADWIVEGGEEVVPAIEVPAIEDAPAIDTGEKSDKQNAEEGEPAEEAPLGAPIEGKLPNLDKDPDGKTNMDALLEGKYIVVGLNDGLVKAVDSRPLVFESAEAAFGTYPHDTVRVFKIVKGCGTMVKEAVPADKGATGPKLPSAPATKSQKQAEQGDGEGTQEPVGKTPNAGKDPDAGTKVSGATPKDKGQTGPKLPEAPATKSQKSAEVLKDSTMLQKMVSAYEKVQRFRKEKKLTSAKKAFIGKFVAEYNQLSEATQVEFKKLLKG